MTPKMSASPTAINARKLAAYTAFTTVWSSSSVIFAAHPVGETFRSL
jgi:hypothetical protein